MTHNLSSSELTSGKRIARAREREAQATTVAEAWAHYKEVQARAANLRGGHGA